MNDYLSNLAARTFNPTAVLQPRLTALFEPLPGSHSSEQFHEQESIDRPPVSPIQQSFASPNSLSSQAAVPIIRPIADFPTLAPALGPHPTVTPAPVIKAVAPIATDIPTAQSAQSSAQPASPILSPKNDPTGIDRLPSPQPAATILSPSHLKAVAEPRSLRPPSLVIQPQIAPLTEPRFAAPELPKPPTIQVTIGRIDVRAIAAPAPARSPTRSPAPQLSLEEYLRSRNGGNR